MSTEVIAFTSSDPAERRVGVAAVLVATLFWSFGGVLAKSTGAEGVVVTFWRTWIAVAVLAMIAGSRKEWVTWADIRRCIPAGVMFAGNIAVFFTALERLSVANALVIAALAPVLMLPIAVGTLGERLTPIKVLCATVAVGGVIVAIRVAPSNGASGSDEVFGYVLAGLGLLIWLGYLVAASGRAGTWTRSRSCSRCRSSPRSRSRSWSRPRRRRSGRSRARVGCGSSCSQSGRGLRDMDWLAWSQRRVDASVSTVLMQAEPVGATIAAYFLLDENVTAPQVLAMSVVIGALCLLVYAESREARIYSPAEASGD